MSNFNGDKRPLGDRSHTTYRSPGPPAEDDPTLRDELGTDGSAAKNGVVETKTNLPSDTENKPVENASGTSTSGESAVTALVVDSAVIAEGNNMDATSVDPVLQPEQESESTLDISVVFGETIPANSLSDPTLATVQTAQVHTDDITPKPRIILVYKTPKSELPNFRESIVEPDIKNLLATIPLPFGTVGTPYESTLEFSSKDLTKSFSKIEIQQCSISSTLSELGLSCQYLVGESSVQLKGIPTKEFSGNIDFGLVRHDWRKCLQDDSKGHKNPVDIIGTKPFIINEHPRNLWKDLPVADEDWEGYKNEHVDNKGTAYEFAPEKREWGGMRPKTIPAQSIEIIAASRRGRSHAHSGKPRDDYFCYEYDQETGWYFAAVADGAGSAKYSRKGSEIACDTAVKHLRGLISQHLESDFAGKIRLEKSHFTKSKGSLTEELKQKFAELTGLDKIFYGAIYAAYDAIVKEAKTKGAVVRDYHTTLICAAFKYFDEADINGWFFASYWVGDGGAAILRWEDDTDSVLVLGEPDGGEFAGQTRFLTMSEEIRPEVVNRRVRFSFCDSDSFNALLLVTDGITDPFFPSESAVADGHSWVEFYEEKLRNGCEEEPNGCPSLANSDVTPQKKSEDLLNWLNFWSKGNHDDRTILIVKPK